MQWAYNSETEVGDINIFNRNGREFVLIEATENGYVELANGEYEEMISFERSYKEATNEIYGNYEGYGADKGTDTWNLQPVKNRADGDRNTGAVSGQRLQTDSSADNEHLRSSNKGKSIDNEADLNDGSAFSNGEKSHKEEQLDIILENNPANDDYHTWIRKVSDIHTFEEALQDSDYEGWEESGFDPDYDGNVAKQALKSGKITVYSSYPIKQGVFVTPSKMEAESYSGNGKVYEKTVLLTDIAWIDPTQGQYAKVDNSAIQNKKNRVIAAQFTSKEVIASTPHSPLSNNNIPQNSDVVNSSISENSQSDTTRYSIDVDNLYSYNNLVSKPDMKIVAIDEDFARNGNIVDRKEILKQAKKENSVYVDDLKENVNITRNGILHFTEKTIKLSSSAVLDTATITPHISEILKNSIVVNELSARPGKNKDIKKSFVLIGIATDTNNDYLVRTIVDKYSNDVLRCDFYNLYATKAKKEEMLGRSPSAVGDNSSNTVPSLNISISDLLQNVKDVGLVTSVLSEDVCNKLGVNRPDSVFKNDLKYSIDVPLEGEVYDTIPPGEKAARKVRVPKKVDGTYTNRFVRTIMEHGDISEYQAELIKMQNDIQKLYKQAQKQGFENGEVTKLP